MKKFIREFFRINFLKTLIYSLKAKKRVFSYFGGKVQFDKRKSIEGNGVLLFNCSQYKDGFHKKGHLWIGKESKLTISEGLVRFYSGCKIDVHNLARLSIGGGDYIQ